MNLDDFELIPVNSNRVKIKKLEDFKDEYVYDLEVEDSSHTFVANNILLHNSLYIRMNAIIKHLFGNKKVDWRDSDKFHKIKDYADNVFQKDINQYCANFVCEEFHTDQRVIEFKREKLSAQGEFCAKKRYIVHVFDNEGLEQEKWGYTGVDIAKNELPDTIKDLLKKFVHGLIEDDWTNDIIQKKLMELYNIYIEMPIKDLAYIKNLVTPKDSTGFLSLEKGAGVHARSAEYYNQLVEKMNIKRKYELINKGDRFYYIYVKETNKYGINAIGWKDRYPTEFEKIFEIDKIKMFEKTILAPLKIILSNHKASSFDPSNIIIPSTVDIDIFDI